MNNLLAQPATALPSALSSSAEPLLKPSLTAAPAGLFADSSAAGSAAGFVPGFARFAQHGERAALHNEIHARPPQPMQTPCAISHIAMLCTPEQRLASRLHVCALLRAYHLPLPDADSAHIRSDFGAFTLRWELHTEFVSYTFIRALDAETAALLQTPQSAPAVALDVVPQAWLAAIAGQALTCLHVWILAGSSPAAPSPPALSSPARLAPGRYLLHEDTLAGACLADGQVQAYTDFALHGDGFSRMLLLVVAVAAEAKEVPDAAETPDTGAVANTSHTSHTSSTSPAAISPRRLGRLAQQLIEIETYRMAALLGLTPARAAFGSLASTETELAALAQDIRSLARDAEAQLLDRLTRLAGQVEGQHAATHARFSASAAYFEMIDKRLADIAEVRLPGLQTIGEFLERRLSPARSTCAWAAHRQDALSQRVSRMSNLLRTRVEIEQQQSSQALLETMNQRQGLQLKLQTTVEGLSVAAITYYTVGLIAYLAKGAQALGWPLSADSTVALAIPLVLLTVWWFIRALHQKIVRQSQA